MLRVAAGRWRAWPRPRRSVGCGPARTRSRGASPRGPWVRAWAGAAWRRCCGPVCSATSFSRTLPPGPRWRCGRWCCTAMTVGWPRRRCTPPRRCGCAGRATGSWSRSPPCPDRSRYRGRPRRAWRPNSSRRARTSRSSTMRRGGRTVVSGLLVAGLVGWLLLMARPARAQTPPPPIGPGRPPCAAGPGGLLGCIPGPGDLLSGAAKSVGGGVMKAFTTFFTDGARWFVEQVESFLVAADRPDLSAGWWVHKYDLMLALAWVVAAATLLLALIDAAAKGSWQGLGRAVLVDVPVAGVVGGFGPLVIQYLVDLADWLSSRLLQPQRAAAGRLCRRAGDDFRGLPGLPGTAAAGQRDLPDRRAGSRGIRGADLAGSQWGGPQDNRGAGGGGHRPAGGGPGDRNGRRCQRLAGRGGQRLAQAVRHRGRRRGVPAAGRVGAVGNAQPHAGGGGGHGCPPAAGRHWRRRPHDGEHRLHRHLPGAAGAGRRYPGRRRPWRHRRGGGLGCFTSGGRCRRHADGRRDRQGGGRHAEAARGDRKSTRLN